MMKVIDVSKWQGAIGYEDVAKSGKVDGVILRSSIANSTDDKFYEYADGFKKVGIPIIGIYHFSHAKNVTDASKEAALAASNAEKAGLAKSIIIFFDFEYESLEKFKSANVSFTDAEVKKEINNMTKKFCSMIESAGYKAGVYYNPDFYNNWFEDSTLKPYVKWVADWRGKKTLPCDIWQYGTIKVDGISNQVDGNECYIDIAAPKPTPKKSNEEVANDVIKGLYGVNPERKKKLEAEGYDYKAVQDIVNKKMAEINKPKTPKKSNEEVANDVIKGIYGVGADRKAKLEAEGYDYKAVQDIVNKKTNGTYQKVSPATKRDTSLSGTYTVTAEKLNLRYIPGVLTNSNVIKLLVKGDKVHNYGYYSVVDGNKWLYIQVGNIVGHVDARYLSK